MEGLQKQGAGRFSVDPEINIIIGAGRFNVDPEKLLYYIPGEIFSKIKVRYEYLKMSISYHERKKPLIETEFIVFHRVKSKGHCLLLFSRGHFGTNKNYLLLHTG